MKPWPKALTSPDDQSLLKIGKAPKKEKKPRIKSLGDLKKHYDDMVNPK